MNEALDNYWDWNAGYGLACLTYADVCIYLEYEPQTKEEEEAGEPMPCMCYWHPNDDDDGFWRQRDDLEKLGQTDAFDDAVELCETFARDAKRLVLNR